MSRIYTIMPCGHIDADQPELMEMTDAVLGKLENISEEEYAELDLIPEL